MAIDGEYFFASLAICDWKTLKSSLFAVFDRYTLYVCLLLTLSLLFKTSTHHSLARHTQNKKFATKNWPFSLVHC